MPENEIPPAMRGDFYCICGVYPPHTAHRYVRRKGYGMEQIRQKVLRDGVAPHPIIETIREVCEQMEIAESRFAQETDPDLIESAIYEMQSLRAKYRYLLRAARTQGVTCQEKAHLWDE